jgi:hypothetical protein
MNDDIGNSAFLLWCAVMRCCCKCICAVMCDVQRVIKEDHSTRVLRTREQDWIVGGWLAWLDLRWQSQV